MSPTLDAFLRSWPVDPWLIAALLIPRRSTCAAGWPCVAATRRDGTAARLAAFLGGLAALFLAFGSPIEPFGALLLQVHMIQHLLLMMVAPPLLWLGAPLFPMIRGLPRPIRVYWVAARPPLDGRSGASSRGSSHPPRRWPSTSPPPGSGTSRRSTRLRCDRRGWHRLQHRLFPRARAAVLVSRRPARIRAGRGGRPGCSCPIS